MSTQRDYTTWLYTLFFTHLHLYTRYLCIDDLGLLFRHGEGVFLLVFILVSFSFFICVLFAQLPHPHTQHTQYSRIGASFCPPWGWSTSVECVCDCIELTTRSLFVHITFTNVHMLRSDLRSTHLGA